MKLKILFTKKPKFKKTKVVGIYYYPGNWDGPFSSNDHILRKHIETVYWIGFIQVYFIFKNKYIKCEYETNYQAPNS